MIEYGGRLAAASLTLLLATAGCERDKVSPPAKVPTSRPTSEVPAHAEYLKGLRICLDPGHGGRAHLVGYKRGPTGLREAEVNLKVALFLRDMLEASGCTVFMTRTEDVYLHERDGEDLRRRSEMANDNRCDLFLSIHHNAGRREANFTSVWYHAGVDHSPASLDIAGELAVALVEGLDLPQHLGCPILSDYLMYPDAGFAVLRHARVPAVLTEGSFHSNPEEEQRLRDPEYNRREARALFMGLARYAYGGLPRAYLVEPVSGLLSATGPTRVVLALDDGISGRKSWGWEQRLILRDSIRVRLGDTDLPFELMTGSDLINVDLPRNLRPGPRELQVQFQNLFKHSNTRPVLNLRVETAGAN